MPCFVVCLPLTSAHLYRILPAPLSLPLVLSVLSAPSAPFSSLCPISVLFCLYLSLILSLPLFHSPSYLLVLSCCSSFFSPLFSSPRPENDFYLFSPLASANLWCWPAEKRTLQNNFHNPPAKLTKIYVSGWLAELPLANKSQCVCVCVCQLSIYVETSIFIFWALSCFQFSASTVYILLVDKSSENIPAHSIPGDTCRLPCVFFIVVVCFVFFWFSPPSLLVPPYYITSLG